MDRRKSLKTIIDREKMSAHPTCPACGRNFSMGETVVVACGTWGDSPRYIHEDDAVYEPADGNYYERKCHEQRVKEG